MALTLDSIYQPINDFFLKTYKTDATSSVFFRFDKFGSLISNNDFLDVNQSGNNGLILERFSDLVNRLPVEDADGLNMLFSSNLIDETYYYRLLNASIPFSKDDNPNKEDIISTISKIISDAKGEFEKSSLARQGIATLFRASYANPENWYDPAGKEIWTSHNFQASETTTTPAPVNNPKFQLWKLKADDSVLENVLSIKNTEPVKPAELYRHVLLMKSNVKPLTATKQDVIRSAVMAATPMNTISLPTIRDHRSDKTATIRDHRDGGTALNSFIIQNSLRTNLTQLDLKQRYVVNGYIKSNAPTQPSTTKSLTISFDYCKVDIRRPWLFNNFLNNNSWFIPGFHKGQLSESDSEVDLTILPIGFIAIKNLSIEANWSDTDLVNSKNATDFGPFEVDAEIVNNKLSHEGIQIIGWILQQMPVLPPVDAPW